MIAPDEPFLCSLSKRWIPREMITPPALDRKERVGPVEPHYALLINPFYSKDANASFGKHVLTPSLALTSFAATTPEHWRVEYWDENLLDGRPPFRPMPGVVGITVHLTFARRAFELADWYRARGAKVVFGGLHVLSCPDECAPHADALALGDGVQLWPRILGDIEANTLQSRYLATYENDYREDPSPRRSLLPRRSFLTTTSLIATRGCHNRCGFCYLATDGLRIPYRMRHPRQVVEEFKADDQPYAVFIDNNLGSRRDYLHSLCAALRPLNKIWSAAVTIDVTDDPGLIRNMALAGCTGVFVGFESLSDDNLADSHKKTPKTSDYARRAHPARLWHPGERIVRAWFRSRPQRCFRAHRGMDRRESPGVRHVSHPHAVSGDAAIPADGSAGAHPASRLDTLRHRPRSISTKTHDCRRTRARIRMDLSEIVFARLDLATQAGAVAGDPPVSSHVLSLQAIQPLLALADQTRLGQPGVEASGGDDPLAAPAVPSRAGAAREPGGGGRASRVGRGLGRTGRNNRQT